MSLTARDVAEIVRVLEESSFDSLELDINGMQLRLKRGGAAVSQSEAVQTRVADRNAVAAQVTTPAPAAVAAVATPAVAGPAGTTPVPAPLLGVYYRAPKPGEPPFVQAGDKVRADSIIGIIEVMKLMNTVRAGFDGEIVQISAVNGELVEYGQPLLWIRKS